MGSVYVFNATPEKLRLSVGNQWLSYSIPPLSGPPYTPYSVTVARGDYATGSITFINGTANAVVVQSRQGQSQPAQVHVPAAPSSTVDLWLYVYWQLLLLIDTNGAVVDSQPLDWGS